MGEVNTKGKGGFLAWMIILGVLAYSLGLSFFAYSWTPGPNYRNVTVDTTVNISGSTPTILSVVMQNPITLNAGVERFITCNVSIRDYNGFADLQVVNASLFHSTSTEGAALDNNTRYVNTSCSPVSQSGIYANYSCGFALEYHALNGTWNCTARVNDSLNLQSLNSNRTNISALYALNITPTLIDFGVIDAGTYSNNISVNVTNIGNLNINVSVLGYARNMSDGYAFVCDFGNYTIGMLKFAANLTASYQQKQNLSSAYQAIAGLRINKTTNTSYSFNETYWQFYAEPTQVAFGNCTGYIVFQAQPS